MPTRLIREGIIDSDGVNTLGWAAEVFYRRLLNKVDDYGLYDARISVLRATLYPLLLSKVSEKHVAQWVDACAAAGLLMVYESEGKEFLQVLNTKWKTRSQPKYPLPDNTCKQLQTVARPIRSRIRSRIEYTETKTAIESEGKRAGKDKAGIPRRILAEEFEETWKAYPRKEGKASALDDFIKARRSGEALAVIAAGVNAYASHIKASGTEPRYVKQGGTWFHQKGWLDDYSSNGATGRRKLRRAE